jgi:flagellar protein FlgJ
MISSLDTARFALNNKPLGDLKPALKQDAAQGAPGQSIKAVAKQFEGMFLNILMRGMRSGGGNSLLDNNETKLYTELLDQQFTQKIADGRGLGLADALVKQITRGQAHAAPSPDAPAQPLPLKKEETAKAFTQGLPGAAPAPLPLHRSEPPGGLPLQGHTADDRGAPSLPSRGREPAMNLATHYLPAR